MFQMIITIKGTNHTINFYLEINMLNLTIHIMHYLKARQNQALRFLLKNFQLNKLSNKKNNILKDENNYISSNTVFLINSVKDIGKIMNKKNKRKFIGSIKKRYSNANGKESSFLMTGENDSFIGSIVNQIKEYKN